MSRQSSQQSDCQSAGHCRFLSGRSTFYSRDPPFTRNPPILSLGGVARAADQPPSLPSIKRCYLGWRSLAKWIRPEASNLLRGEPPTPCCPQPMATRPPFSQTHMISSPGEALPVYRGVWHDISPQCIWEVDRIYSLGNIIHHILFLWYGFTHRSLSRGICIWFWTVDLIMDLLFFIHNMTAPRL